MSWLQNFFGETTDGDNEPSFTIRINPSENVKPIDDADSFKEQFASIWRSSCHYRAVSTCLEMRIADVIGNDTLDVNDLADRLKCENITGFMALLRVLSEVGIMTIEYIENEDATNVNVCLTPMGAVLQRVESNNILPLMDAMFDDNAQSMWTNLNSLLTRDDYLPELNDEILMLRTSDLNNTFYNDMVVAIEALRLTQISSTIAYWGGEDFSSVLKSSNPDARVVVLEKFDEISETRYDYVVAHRVLSMYGVDRTIESIKKSLNPGGFLVVIDTCQSIRSSCEDLYAHACHIPPTPTMKEWLSLFSPHFEIVENQSMNDNIIFKLIPSV